jgi:hypothetical protein
VGQRLDLQRWAGLEEGRGPRSGSRKEGQRDNLSNGATMVHGEPGGVVESPANARLWSWVSRPSSHASAEGEQKVCKFRSLLLSLIGCQADAHSASILEKDRGRGP